MRSIFRGDRFIQFYFKTFSTFSFPTGMTRHAQLRQTKKNTKKPLNVKNDNYTKNLKKKIIKHDRVISYSAVKTSSVLSLITNNVATQRSLLRRCFSIHSCHLTYDIPRHLPYIYVRSSMIKPWSTDKQQNTALVLS